MAGWNMMVHRQLAGHTQAEMSERLNRHLDPAHRMDRWKLAQVERGDVPASLSLSVAFCTALGLNERALTMSPREVMEIVAKAAERERLAQTQKE